MDERINQAVERNTRRIYGDERNQGYYSEADVRQGLELIARDILGHDGTVDEAIAQLDAATFAGLGDALLFL